MMVDKIKSRIAEMCTLFGFEYSGKDGNVDPYYLPETGKSEFLLFFDGNEQVVDNIDDVMSTPFIDGKSLNEIADKITITDW